jgi:hypothetical protein
MVRPLLLLMLVTFPLARDIIDVHSFCVIRCSTLSGNPW